MQAYGSDRLRLDGERVVLSSRLDKGWKARVPKTLTSAEFPGTAVLWDERYYEVIAAEPLPQGVRYTLESWLEHHVMRTSERYDAASEDERLAEARRARERESRRTSAVLLAPLTGHLPASVQEHLGSELGILAPRLTMASAATVFAVAIALLLWIVGRRIRATPLPPAVLLIAGYLFLECAIRLYIAAMQGRPIGSAAGLLLYSLWYGTLADRKRAISPFVYAKGWSVRASEAPPDVAERDAFTLREPLVTLLTPAEQARAAARFGYDWRRQSSKIAALILICAALGVVSSIHTGAVIAFAVALLLAVEQIWRLVVLRSRPAGSIVAFAARPFVRKLL